MPLSRPAIALLLALVPGLSTAADKWPVVDPAELATKTPKVEPNADAEAFLWDVRVTADSAQGLTKVSTTFQNYIRIKIFTDRGRETQSQVAIRYRDDAVNQTRIEEVEARTIAPDGTISELQAKDIFDRSAVEQNGLKMRTKSFALPAVVIGSILEYRWKEIHEDTVTNYLPLPFQRDIPIQVVRYHVRPIALPGLEPRSQVFNVDAAAVRSSNEKDGYTGIEVRNMRALKREPYMPPTNSVEAWTLVFYQNRAQLDASDADFWRGYAKARYELYKPHFRVTDDIKKLALDATRSLTTPQEKINALVTLARQKVKRIDVDTVSATERRAFRANLDTAEVLRKGVGTGQDINGLFIALATGAGLEARMALAPDRSVSLGQPNLRQPNFVRYILAAVKVGTSWQFVDPSNEHARNGHPRWQQEGTQALVLDSDAPGFAGVPLLLPERSLRKRTGTLKLSENGTLEGNLTFEYTGHWAVQFRERDDGQSPAEIENFFKNELGRQIAGSVISNVTVEHLTEPEQPYVVHLRLSAPGYAQVTGNRLFLQPAVMVRGVDSTFSATDRQHSIHFPFAYSEEDGITIELPPGFEMEAGTAPPKAFGIDNGATARYVPAITMSPDKRQLTYARALSFGHNGRIFYQRTDYPAIKTFFDSIHTTDNYTVPIARAAAGGGAR